MTFDKPMSLLDKLALLSFRQKILIAAGVLLVVVIGFWIYLSAKTVPVTKEGMTQEVAQEKRGWFWRKKIEEAPAQEEIKSENILKTIKIGEATIEIKKEPPKITIVSPGVIADRNISENRAPHLRSITSFVEIKGQVSPWNSILEINDIEAKVNELGGFSFPVILKEGKNSFKFVATHEDMGETKSERYIIFHDEKIEIVKKRAQLEKELKKIAEKYK